MSKKIKVVEFVTRLEFGGVESMLLNYILHFKNPELFDLHVITQDINDLRCIRQFEEAGFTVHIVTHKRKNIIKNVIEIYRIMQNERFDIAHSHMTLTNFYVLSMAAALRVPVRISHAHSALNDGGTKAKFAYPVLKRLNIMFANVLMACGHDAGVFLYGKSAVESGEVCIVNNAIELKKFKRNSEIEKTIREKLQIEDKLCIGHIGRFMSEKNHDFIIKIFSEVIKLKHDAILLLVGDGELRGTVQRQADELGLNKNVIFTGNVTNTHELYQVMDAFLLPSSYEGLPVVAIEAQAAGVDCLVSDRVDRRCAVTPRIKFMSIEKSAQEWAREVLKLAENRQSNYDVESLRAAGYDITIESEKLEQIYKKRL